MKTITSKTINIKQWAFTILCGLAVAACHDNDNNLQPAEFSYRLTAQNLTNNQPMSPLAFALHGASFNPWQIGMPASESLEKLAEGGDASSFLSDSELVASVAANDILLPGMSQSLELTVASKDQLMFSAATMLVNTNDAFTGVKQQDISALEVGEALHLIAVVYDSGTEANTESVGTMPGPADNGEGYNAIRDDVGFVARHSGIVSNDDGLAMSVLNQSHRFEAKVAQFTFERIK